MGYEALIQAAIGLYGEEAARQLSEKQLKLLERQLTDVRNVKLPTLEELKAEELGESEVGKLRSDENLRGKQLQALGYIQNLIDQGGLDFTDRANLEEAMGAAAAQQRQARAGVAQDAAQRGQLNSGARLMMDMDAAQAGSNAARQAGFETAAMAQRRRLQAIQESARMAGGLRESDWREKEAAARAKDIRDERNASAREKAQYYNAGLAQQNFNNAMAKATGQQPATGAVGNALAAGAQDARASAAGMAGVVGAAGNPSAYGGVNSNASAGGGGSYTYTADPNNLTALSSNEYRGGSSNEDEWENPYK